MKGIAGFILFVIFVISTVLVYAGAYSVYEDFSGDVVPPFFTNGTVDDGVLVLIPAGADNYQSYFYWYYPVQGYGLDTGNGVCVSFRVYHGRFDELEVILMDENSGKYVTVDILPLAGRISVWEGEWVGGGGLVRSTELRPRYGEWVDVRVCEKNSMLQVIYGGQELRAPVLELPTLDRIEVDAKVWTVTTDKPVEIDSFSIRSPCDFYSENVLGLPSATSLPVSDKILIAVDGLLFLLLLIIIARR